MEKFNFNNASNGLILGAGHGIGLELDRLIREKYPKIQLMSTFHDAEKNNNPKAVMLDPLNESNISELAGSLDRLDFVISTIGHLGDDPEKSLRQIDLEKLTHSFQVNAIHMPLVMKHLYRKLSSGSLVSALSAMVGSVSDNHMGGWYGYRSSKSALNMFMRNMSIELRKSIVVSVHPGTTKTELSKDFLSGVSHQVYTAAQTAEHLVEFWNSRSSKDSGKFYHWNGQELQY